MTTTHRRAGFYGLPSPASCGRKGARCQAPGGKCVPGVCPLQLTHGHLELPSPAQAAGSPGGALQTADVSLHQADWPLTSVCFHSSDGYHHDFWSTIVRPGEFPESAKNEGVSQTELVLLADGRTILALSRLGGGDGPPDRAHPGKHFSYYQDVVEHRSRDWARSWSRGKILTGVGSTGPRLLMLGNLLMMTVGRQVSPTHGLAGTDPRIFVSRSGMADDWEEHSISAEHNRRIEDTTLRFSSCVNGTGCPTATVSRENSGLSSLLRVNASSALLIYDKIAPDVPSAHESDSRVPYPVVFAMQIVV